MAIANRGEKFLLWVGHNASPSLPPTNPSTPASRVGLPASASSTRREISDPRSGVMLTWKPLTSRTAGTIDQRAPAVTVTPGRTRHVS